jgi:hypothetical protein
MTAYLVEDAALASDREPRWRRAVLRVQPRTLPWSSVSGTLAANRLRKSPSRYSSPFDKNSALPFSKQTDTITMLSDDVQYPPSFGFADVVGGSLGKRWAGIPSCSSRTTGVGLCEAGCRSDRVCLLCGHHPWRHHVCEYRTISLEGPCCRPSAGPRTSSGAPCRLGSDHHRC